MAVVGVPGAAQVARGGNMQGRPIVIDSADIASETWEDPAHGSISWQTLISAGITQTDSIVCGVATLEAGDDFALHHHAEPEVYFGVEGTATVMIDGTPCHLAPGVAIYVPSNAVHGIAAVEARVRFFYVFAADSFDSIRYSFAAAQSAVSHH